MKILRLDRHSVAVRFAAGLGGNTVRGGLNLLAGVLVARALGPARYGDLTFLLVSFTAANRLVDLGTSTAFFTLIARRKRSGRFYLYYLGWIALQFIATLLLITVVVPEGWQQRIWLGHARGVVLLAFVASFLMNQVWNLAAAIGESVRETIVVQMRNVGLAIVYVAGIAVLAASGNLSVRTALWLNIAIYAVFSASLFVYLRARVLTPAGETDRLIDVSRTFVRYSSPLVVSVIVSFIYTFADTWMLQRFGGPAQQGFYSVGERFSSVSLLVTTSMIPVFWKETAEAIEHGQYRKAAEAYYRTSVTLFFVAALLSCFAVPYAREILGALLGDKFEAGWVALGIMLIYPVYQSLGQVNGTFLYAAGLTRLYRNTVIAITVLSLFVTYFLLAPPRAFVGGLGLGAIGLALKMVLLGFLGANLQAFFIRKRYALRQTYWYQACTLSMLLALAFSGKALIARVLLLFGTAATIWILLPLGLIFYLSGAAGVVWLFPELAGLTKDKLALMRGQLRTVFEAQR